jgi:MFS family permease
MLGVAAFELGNCAATLLILRVTTLLESTRGPGLAARLALGLYVAHNVAAAVTSVPAGRAADRRGALSVLAFGAAFSLLAYLGFAVGQPSLTLLAFAFVAAGVGIGCIETAQHASVATLAPAEVRGSAFGVLAAIQGFGNLAASIVAGLLWSLVSASVAFLYLATWMVLSIVGITAARLGR